LCCSLVPAPSRSRVGCTQPRRPRSMSLVCGTILVMAQTSAASHQAAITARCFGAAVRAEWPSATAWATEQHQPTEHDPSPATQA
jgi:hypothetical protein